MHYIYVIQNKISCKIYVGKTNNPYKRFKYHCYVASGKTTKKYLLHRSMMKHGLSNFSFQVIEEFDSEADANCSEQFWIEYFRSDVSRFGPNHGYNLTAGGEGVVGLRHSQEAKDKVSKANTGRVFSPETIKKMSDSHIGITSGMLGKSHSPEYKNRLSLSASGDKNYFFGKKYLGESNHLAKLTTEQVIEILKLTDAGELKQKEIALRYNVSALIISRIKRRVTYTNIKYP